MAKYAIPTIVASLASSTTGVAIGCGSAFLTYTAVQSQLFQLYSWSLFCATPFIQGLICSIIFCNLRKNASFLRTSCVALLSAFFMLAGMLVFALEGVICLVMALPLWLPVSMLGTYVGYRLPIRNFDVKNRSLLILLTTITLPASLGFDYATEKENYKRT